MKISIRILLAVIGIMALVGSALAQGEWSVTRDKPAVLGAQVGRGEHSSSTNPDLRWQAPDDGLLQTVFFDHDPKCQQTAGYVRLEKDGSLLANYPIPTAAWVAGRDCNNPIDSEYTSRVFDVESSMFVDGDIGDTSGWFEFNFSTYTPQPAGTPTATLPPTSTAQPPGTDAPTPTPVQTIVLTATVTLTPTSVLGPTPAGSPTPKPTAVGTPPTPLAICLAVYTVPPLPEAISAEGFVADLYVEAVNADGYLLYDGGEEYVYSAQEPLRAITFYPNRLYSVTVSEDAAPCMLGRVPTNLAPGEQPHLPHGYGIMLPLVSR